MPSTSPATPSFTELTDSQKLLVIGLAVNTLQEGFKAHDKILVTGNGEPSLQEQVRNMQAFTANLKYWLRFLAGAIIVQTVAFAGAALVYFVRLYPLLETISSQTKP